MQHKDFSVVKRRISLLVCRSTQRLVAEMATREPDGLLITSDYQTEGKGQQERSWQSEVAQNLLFTLLLRPTFLSTDRLFLISMAASLALYDLLSPLKLPNLAIKWPNDILADGRKLAGTLIETKIRSNCVQYAMVGIGLNVNQRRFTLPSATSLALLLEKSFDRAELLNDWLSCFAARYELLRQPKQHEAIHRDYQRYLLNIDRLARYQLPGATSFSAVLTGVDLRGQLCLSSDQSTRYFSPGAITYLGSD